VAAAVAVVEEAPAVLVPVTDVASILKAKSGAKGGTGKKTVAVVSEAQKIAMAEALKAEKNKKKRDKSKFNETSY
jgi:hypothetical protein